MISLLITRFLSRLPVYPPFKVVYGIDPLSPLDLTLRPLDQQPSVDVVGRVEEIQKIHELVRGRIEKTNA